MKNIIIKIATVALALFSASAFAEKIIISGKPIILQKQGDLYTVPQDTKLSQTYQYVNIDGKDRACFLDKRPDFTNLDVVTINVKLGDNSNAAWNCYSLDPTYFIIQN